MGNDFFVIHFIVFSTVNGFTRKQVFENIACAFPIDILDSSGKLDICAFQHLLEPVQFPGTFSDKAFAVADKFTQFTLVFIRNITGL